MLSPIAGNEFCQEVVYNELPPIKAKLNSGVAITETISCKEYQYYTMDVPSACSSLNVWVGDSSHDNTTVPELAISQWPNLRPTFDNMAWISYEWMENNMTISTFDPNFFGGKRCGQHKNEGCIVIIGVLGYCSFSATTDSFQYTLKATISPAHKIYGEPQVKNSVAANGIRSYEFCIPENSTSISGATDTAVELIAHSSSCNCENEYTNLEMFVSRRKPNATESDLVWHISHLERLTAIKLLSSDSDTRAGGFYVTVFGWCTEDAQCSDQCSCAPCSNLENASYTLKVSGEMDYDYSRDSIDYLDPCTSDGTCSSTCSYSPSTSSNHRNRNKLSRSAIIGIVFACFAFLLLLAVGVYLVRVHLSKQFYSSPDSELASEADSTTEMVQMKTMV